MIVLSKGQLGEPAACHCMAGHLHYSLVSKPSSSREEKRITPDVSVRLLLELFSRSSLQTAPDVECTEEKPYAFIAYCVMYDQPK